MRKAVIVLTVLIAGGLGGAAYSRSIKSADSGFKTVLVTRGEVVEKALAVGAIKPKQEISVKSKISGIVRRTYHEVGDYVSAGEPLFEISPDPTPLELTEARREFAAQAGELVVQVLPVLQHAVGPPAKTRQLGGPLGRGALGRDLPGQRGQIGGQACGRGDRQSTLEAAAQAADDARPIGCRVRRAARRQRHCGLGVEFGGDGIRRIAVPARDELAQALLQALRVGAAARQHAF